MPVPQITVARLAADGTDLLFRCADCGASVVAPIHKVVERFGVSATLEDVRAPVVCKHCGSIDVAVMPLSGAAAA